MPLNSNDPRDIEKFVESQTGLFISTTPLTIAQCTAALAARYPWRLAIVSNGAGNKHIAISNGTIFRYLEGTAV